MTRRWIMGLALSGFPLSPAAAQFTGDYGGGWGPSLDTSIAIGRDVIANEAGVRAGGAKPTRTPRRTSQAAPRRMSAAELARTCDWIRANVDKLQPKTREQFHRFCD